MKKLVFLVISTILFVSISLSQVGINTDGSNSDASAILDLKSLEKGLLAPRMSETELASILNPANGLIVYNTTVDKLFIYVSNDNRWKEISYGSSALVPIVTNSTTGKVWMDRNLGASRVATASNDALAYGDLYQWGRLNDGHGSRTSGINFTLSATDNPGHDDFIVAPTSPKDWRSPQNDLLWQGLAGINNPCPEAFRIPTNAEWNSERLSWNTGQNNATGAYNSPLKLTVGGARGNAGATIETDGDRGYYWSSTVSSPNSWFLSFLSGNAGNYNNYQRADGMSVRCIRD